MQRSKVGIWTLIAMVGLLGGTSISLTPLRVRASNAPPSDRPGDAAYTPTRLEWAALELQAGFGRTVSTTKDVGIGFLPLKDGTTVLCLLQYTPDVSAEAVKTERDLTQLEFERYVKSRGWYWLRLEFRENALPRPNR